MTVKMGILFLQKLHRKSPAPAVMRRKNPDSRSCRDFLRLAYSRLPGVALLVVEVHTGNGGAGDRSYILTMGLKMVLMALICLALGVGAAALAAGIAAAWMGAGLFPVSVICCALVLLIELFV